MKTPDLETSRGMPQGSTLQSAGPGGLETLPGMWTLIFSGTFLDGHWGKNGGRWWDMRFFAFEWPFLHKDVLLECIGSGQTVSI